MLIILDSGGQVSIMWLLFGQATHPRNEVSSLGDLRMSSVKRLKRKKKNRLKKPISLFSDMSYTESKCLVMVC